MRKIGGHVSVAGGLPNAVANTLNIEGTCLQIFAGSPRSWARFPYDPKQVKSFRTLVESHDLDPVFIHALYLINLASDNEELLEKSTASLIADLDNGEKIGSAGVVVHIGSHQGRGFDSVSQQLIEVIELILSRTSNTPLLLENDAGQNGKIGALNEINFLIDKIRDPRLQVCLDTAHLYEAGYDFTSDLGLEKLISELSEFDLLDKLALLHLNDSATDLNSHRDMHANLGEGKIGLTGLSKLINHPKLNHLPLILEVPGENKMGPNKENILKANKICS